MTYILGNVLAYLLSSEGLFDSAPSVITSDEI